MPSSPTSDHGLGMESVLMSSGPAGGGIAVDMSHGISGKDRLSLYRKWYHQLDRKRSELQEIGGGDSRVIRTLTAELKCLEELMVVSTELAELHPALIEEPVSSLRRLPSKTSLGINGVDAWPGDGSAPPVEGLDLSLVTDMLLLSTTSPWVVYVAERTTWNLCYVSPSSRRLLGWRQSELVGQKAWDCCHSDDLPNLNKMLSESDSGSKTSGILFRRLKRDRSYITVQGVGRALGQRWFAWMELAQEEEPEPRASPRNVLEAPASLLPMVKPSSVRPASPSSLVKGLRRLSSSNDRGGARDPITVNPDPILLPPLTSAPRPRDVYASLDLPPSYPSLEKTSPLQANTLDLSCIPPPSERCIPAYEQPPSNSRPPSPLESTPTGALEPLPTQVSKAASPLRGGGGIAGPSGRPLRPSTAAGAAGRRAISRGPSSERLDMHMMGGSPLAPLERTPGAYAMSEGSGVEGDYLLENFDFRRRSVAGLELEEQALGINHPRKGSMGGSSAALMALPGRKEFDGNRRYKPKSPTEESPEGSPAPVLGPPPPLTYSPPPPSGDLTPVPPPPAETSVRRGRRSNFGPEELAELVSALNLQPGTKPRVLLVEDDVVNRTVGQRLLESLQCEVTVTCNGKEALEIMRGDPEASGYMGPLLEGGLVKPSFDLVLMDLLMPVMDGLRAVERYRQWEGEQNPKRKRMLIFALTGNVTDGDMVKCAQSGFDEFVSKPLTLDKLLHRLYGINKNGAGRLQQDFANMSAT